VGLSNEALEAPMFESSVSREWKFPHHRVGPCGPEGPVVGPRRTLPPGGRGDRSL